MTAAGKAFEQDAACKTAECGLYQLAEQARMHVPDPESDYPARDEDPLYAARKAIYPQHVTGTFRRINWAVLCVTLGVYYALPFVRWDRGVHAPDQAVLIDFPNRRFYFFFVEIWPQEIYYITGLLILAALALFLMNAVAGRVWCGYLCPQTVWTDLFQMVERWIEGDRREHLQRDAGPWTVDRIARLIVKHFAWMMIAWWTGGAWVLYFADAPTLVRDLATLQAPPTAYTWIAILTATTYVFAGHMREQVCLYMCPWPRIQAALTDEWALNVTYRYERGEPRGSFKKNSVLRAKGFPAGDCIDCVQCVNVCPTGVDIRNGPNLGCIQCGLCIDACDAVMAKINRPVRLIAYDTDINIRRRSDGLAPIYRIVRGRTILYAMIIAIVGAIMVYALATRSTEDVSVVHDRNPIFVRLSDGRVRNAFTLQVINKARAPRSFRLSVEGLPNLRIEIVGSTLGTDDHPVIEVGPDQTHDVRLLVTAPAAPSGGMTPLTFRIIDTATGQTAITADHFRGPVP